MVTILIVEDQAHILDQLEALLMTNFKDIQTLKAQTFLDAKEIIEGGNADIFIVDFGLPDVMAST